MRRPSIAVTITQMDELERIVGSQHVERGAVVGDDALRVVAATLVRPGSADEVAQVVAWCYAHDVAIVPVGGGGSGLAGGAAVVEEDAAGIAVSLERLRAIRSFPAGAVADGGRGGRDDGDDRAARARERPVLPARPRRAQAVAARRALLTGSEGTLGIMTAAWLRFVPAPEAQHVVVAAYDDAAAGCAAVLRVLAGGVVAAALEFFDEGAVGHAGATFPGGELRGFVVVAEADAGVTACRSRSPRRAAPSSPRTSPCRSTASRRRSRPRCRSARGTTCRPAPGATRATATSMRRSCSIRATTRSARAEAAPHELFDVAVALGGTVTAEHGIGVLTAGRLARQ